MVRRTRRPALLACGLLTALASGCIPAERRAGQSQNLIHIGMSREEVREAAGEGYPEPWDEGEVWHYAYRPLPDPSKIALTAGQTLAIVAVAAPIVACWIWMESRGGATSGEPTFPTFGGAAPDYSTSWAKVHFRVKFDADGRVRLVTGIEPCDERR